MRSLERALDVLAVLEQQGRPLRLSEVAAEASLHIATTQRILAVLERRGYVAKDNGRYHLGVATVPLAHAFLIGNPLSRAATPVLQELAAGTGLTASLFVRDGLDRIVIGRVQGAQPLRYVLPIGERLPLHLGAGRVLVAEMPDADVDALLARAGEVRLVSGGTMTPDEFHASLKKIRDDGYLVARSERVLGVTSASAPVHLASGQVAGAVVVSGNDENIAPDAVEGLVAQVRQAASAIEQRYRYS